MNDKPVNGNAPACASTDEGTAKLAFNQSREDHKVENRRGANGKKF